MHTAVLSVKPMFRKVAVQDREAPLLIPEQSSYFFQMDTGANYKLQLNKSLNIGIKNIFNAYQEDSKRGADRDPAFVYGPIRPGTFYFGMETAFQLKKGANKCAVSLICTAHQSSLTPC